MTHTVDSLMALHHAATAAALQYADCARVSLRSARSMQAADDRNEANDALRAALTEALAAPQAVPAWLPIESAPKDGTDILVMYMHIDTQIVHNAFWLGDEDYDTDPSGWWTYEHSEVSRLLLDGWMTPTHWMPLPAAPKGAA